jgi:hypothetical protein
MRQPENGNCLPHSFRKSHRAVSIGVRKNNGKFLAPAARCKI